METTFVRRPHLRSKQDKRCGPNVPPIHGTRCERRALVKGNQRTAGAKGKKNRKTSDTDIPWYIRARNIQSHERNALFTD